MKKFICILSAAILIVSCFSVCSFAFDSDYNPNDYCYNYYVLSGYYLIVNIGEVNSNSFYNSQLIIPSDKSQYFSFTTEGLLINTSSSTITVPIYSIDGYTLYTGRFTSFGSLEIRLKVSLSSTSYSYYSAPINVSDIVYSSFDLSTPFNEFNNDFDIPTVYNFSKFEVATVSCLIVICFFSLFNWIMLHKKMR